MAITYGQGLAKIFIDGKIWDVDRMAELQDNVGCKLRLGIKVGTVFDMPYQIGELRVYNSTRTVEQIEAAYISTSTCETSASLVGCYLHRNETGAVADHSPAKQDLISNGSMPTFEFPDAVLPTDLSYTSNSRCIKPANDSWCKHSPSVSDLPEQVRDREIFQNLMSNTIIQGSLTIIGDDCQIKLQNYLCSIYYAYCEEDVRLQHRVSDISLLSEDEKKYLPGPIHASVPVLPCEGACTELFENCSDDLNFLLGLLESAPFPDAASVKSQLGQVFPCYFNLTSSRRTVGAQLFAYAKPYNSSQQEYFSVSRYQFTSSKVIVERILLHSALRN